MRITDNPQNSEERQAELRESLLAWAETPMNVVEQVQNEQPDVDIAKFSAGSALDIILNDDGNCFYWDFGGYNASTVVINSEALKTRMNWEVSLEKMPREVAKIIRDSGKKFFSNDWGDETKYKRTSSEWKEMRKHVDKLQNANTPLGEEIRGLMSYSRSLRSR